MSILYKDEQQIQYNPYQNPSDFFFFLALIEKPIRKIRNLKKLAPNSQNQNQNETEKTPEKEDKAGRLTKL